ncbi:hypothetical protein GCM10007898_42530 [Dyella flagellata]|uniref:Uncharacterized protein n=1 Tax=Dyella flagellata TaxID=1867833 RepID=A0ABQ5XIA5_9GAMM|nr:hypothetical protein GCM10007898_42530 [Dyella flagellata]
MIVAEAVDGFEPLSAAHGGDGLINAAFCIDEFTTWMSASLHQLAVLRWIRGKADRWQNQ